MFWLPFLLAEIKAGRLTKKIWLLALLPFIPNVIMQNFWALAFYYIDPGFVTLLVTTSIIWVVILSIILFRDERRLIKSKLFRFSIILSIIGVVGVTLSNPSVHKPLTITGIIIVLLYDFIWGFYAIAVKVSMKNIDSRIGFSVISIYTTAGLAIPMMLFGKAGQMLEMPFTGWLVAVVSGITGIGLGHVFYYVSIHRLGSTVSALSLLAQPFVVIIFSYILFGEKLTAVQWLFGIVLVAGSAMAIIAEKAPDLTEPPIG